MKKWISHLICSVTLHGRRYVHLVRIDGEEFYETTCTCGKYKRYASADDNVYLGYQNP